MDDFNREALGIEIDFSLPAERVIRALRQIIAWRGKPQVIRCDNGPEYISATIQRMGTCLGHQARIHPAGQASAKRLCGAVQPNGALRMAVTALLGRSAGGSNVRHPVDVEIQSRPPEYGPWRHHPQAATAHGCITVLLLTSVENGGITTPQGIPCLVKPCCTSSLNPPQHKLLQ